MTEEKSQEWVNPYRSNLGVLLTHLVKSATVLEWIAFIWIGVVFCIFSRPIPQLDD